MSNTESYQAARLSLASAVQRFSIASAATPASASIRRGGSGQSVVQLSTLSSKALVAYVDDVRMDSQRMRTENMVFEKFLQANEPQMVEKMTVTMDKVRDLVLTRAASIESQTHQQDSAGTRSQTRMSEGRISVMTDAASLSISPSDAFPLTGRMHKGPRINLTLKTDLVLREMDKIQEKLEAFVTKTKAEKRKIVAENEEYSNRNAELTDARNNFEQHVVVEGMEELTQRIPAEKFVWYMQEWLKFSQTLLEKLRLRTCSLRVQYRKLKQVYAQKEELSESVNEADFEQYGIANRNFEIELDHKKHYLMELKRMNGQSNLMVATHKNFLAKQQVNLNNLIVKTNQTKQDVRDIAIDLQNTLEKVDRYKAQLKEIHVLRKHFKVPDIIDYVMRKAELNELKKARKVLLRKVRIQDVAKQTCVNTMKQLSGSSKIQPAWFDSEISTPDSVDSIVMREPSMITSGSLINWFGAQ